MEDSNNVLINNLNLLKARDPILANQLSSTDPTALQFCLTKAKQVNLQRSFQEKTYHYHSIEDAEKEAAVRIENSHLQSASLLFVYGIGLGYDYKAALPWLKSNPLNRIVFFEEDPGVLYRLFETDRGTEILNDPQVRLIYLKDPMEEQSNKYIFNDLSWSYFNYSFVFIPLKLYQEVNPAGCSQIERELQRYFEMKKLFVDEYLQYGIVFYRNFYPNMLTLPESYEGTGLFDRFPQVPAIICGAGPSLAKNMHLLRNIKDKALIFAGGSALSALIPQKIIPHFGVAVDPNYTQYSRIAGCEQEEFPFFYKSRLFHTALKAIRGPRLYLTGVSGFSTPQWFEQKLNIVQKDLADGHNVVNMSVEIAKALGCNPIVFVGVDLAFTNKQYYADGIATHLQLSEDELSTEEGAIVSEDFEGKPIKTLWKWIIESEWISEKAQEYSHLTFINATEGGIGFKEVVNIPLEKVIDTYMTHSREEIGRIAEWIQNLSLHSLTQKRILELYEELTVSLRRSSQLIAQLIDEDDRLIKEHEEGDISKNGIDSYGKIQIQLEIEPAYESILNIFNQIYTHLHRRELREIEQDQRLSAAEKAIRQLQHDKMRLIFLEETAQVNKELIKLAVKTKGH